MDKVIESAIEKIVIKLLEKPATSMSTEPVIALTARHRTMHHLKQE